MASKWSKWAETKAREIALKNCIGLEAMCDVRDALDSALEEVARAAFWVGGEVKPGETVDEEMLLWRVRERLEGQ